MTILRNSICFLLILTILFVGCIEQQKKYLIPEQEVPIKENYTTVYFINSLDKKPLYNFRFGRYFNGEELPTKIILDRDSFGLIHETYISINHEQLNKGDSIYGYFEKSGFEATFFNINPKLNKQVIEIVPHPSEIIIKAIDEEFRYNFDSIEFIVNKEIVNQEIKQSSTSNLVREDFVFTPNHLSEDLSIFNYYIYPNEILKIQLRVFNKLKSYTLNYEIKYQPFITTVLKVY